ncbi:Gpalpp Motifs-Containing Protein 1 [Manis pentadactyla]|nr:Gpalpp Motifs-Containing Protein 1 [Manis pentadactyla]
MARELIGPALPPGFKARGTAEDEEREPSPVAGPALPPNYKSSNSESSDSDEDSSSLYEEGNQESEDDDPGPTARKQRRNQDNDDDDEGFFGPALPPGFKKQDDSPPRPIIGPALPPGFIKSAQKSDKGRDDPGQQETGSSEDEDIVGPMPAKGPVNYSVTTEFEKRAQRMKEKLTKGDDDSSRQITRESWMTELPPEMKDFGLGPRTFKRRADDKSGDRSVWTDTPADRERKAKEAQEARKSLNKKDEEHILSGREKRLAEQVSSYNESKRSESLMDIHHKKLKNKAAEDKNKPQERTPFDRDKDLKVHRFDEAQKKALIKKSRELNTRFSHGKGKPPLRQSSLSNHASHLGARGGQLGPTFRSQMIHIICPISFNGNFHWLMS